MRKITEILNESTVFKSFTDEIQEVGGKVYYVGGKVRDDVIGRENKDIDLLVTGVPFDNLIELLNNYGTIKPIGKTFNIIFFKETKTGEEYEIAIPRKEKKAGKGYHGFEMEYDSNLPIEEDLYRRDFTINAMAKGLDGEIIDPFGGLEDIKNKVIRLVNPKAFSEDPLRMIRCVQFSARLGFDIEEQTFNEIKKNTHNIKDISSDRILIEFDKMVNKGDPSIGIELLDKSKLFNYIFDTNFVGSYSIFKDVKNMGDFIYLCLKDTDKNPSDYYKNNLDGDRLFTNYIKSLEKLKDINTDTVNNRLVVSEMYRISPSIISSGVLPKPVEDVLNDFKMSKYPKSIDELVINGKDLMDLGYVGENIGKMKNKILYLIYADKLVNDRKSILTYLNE